MEGKGRVVVGMLCVAGHCVPGRILWGGKVIPYWQLLILVIGTKTTN